MKKRFANIMSGLLFIGLVLILYPTVSRYISSKRSSKAIADYIVAAEANTDSETVAILEKAEQYNQALREAPAAFYEPSLVSGYDETLDISGTGIMGYISISKIDVSLPIYHGTDDSVMQVGVGHMEGTSLPIGGVSTHTVMTAHRGLPSARLFADLDRLEKGDRFTITVADRVLTYEVDSIKTVEPDDARDLQIEEGKDLCTIFTCTPYGVNSHRLLVRGSRVYE